MQIFDKIAQWVQAHGKRAPAQTYIPKTIRIPTAEDVEAERKRLKKQREYTRLLRNTVYVLIITAAIAALLATLFFPVLQVSGDSMEPTLENQDVILLRKTEHLKTGDLCGFYWQNKLLLKRVIAGPGDVVDIDENGVVSVNGRDLYEPYVDELALGNTDLTYPYQVPEDRYFMLGDHRAVSVDSRNSAIGCIETEQIIGKVIWRIWPLSHFQRIHA